MKTVERLPKVLSKTASLFLAVVCFASLVQAAPGDLDLSFDSDGKVVTAVGTGNDEASDVAVQTDGKIVVAGTSNGSGTDFSLVRYNSNGSLDSTFGTGGKVLSQVAGSQTANAVAIQPDGKIVVVGNGSGSASFLSSIMYRYNSDGTLDTTFGGGDGIVVEGLGINSSFNDVLILSDGKILIAGELNPSPRPLFLIARFNSDGSFDNTFSGDGYLTAGTVTTNSTQAAYGLAIQADGKIVAGGKQNDESGAWLRVNADGSADGANFDLIGAPFIIQNVAIQADQKIIFSATFSVARYNSNKSLDTAFGNNGVGRAEFGSSLSGKGLAVQTDGRIIVGGAANGDFALARFNTNGFLDTGFGTAGKVVTPIGTADDQINNLALQADGKIVAAGRTMNGSNNDFSSARYIGGGSSTIPNQTPYDFDGDGKADLTVFRSGAWYILQTLDNSFKTVNFGQTNDVIVPADYDGDSRTDTAVFRPSNTNWYYLRSSDNGFVSVQFGTADSLPRPGDFDGDGKADVAVFYPPNGNWYIRESRLLNTRIVNFGTSGDVPVIANFDGDAKDDIAVYRPSGGVWYYLQSTDNGFRAANFGQNGDLPVTADYDGDGKTDLAVFRPSNGTWYLNRSTSGFAAVNFGTVSDRPAAADYDGDGRADTTVFRPANGVWYQLQSTNGFAAAQWGTNGDVPAPSAYVP